VEEGLGLYVVCDGASGRPAGEIAARVAAEALEEFVERSEAEFSPDLWEGAHSTRVVERALRYAIAAGVKVAGTDPGLRGMTTTVTVLLAHGRRGLIGHTGDSRAYLIRRKRVHQLTLDHELTDALVNGGSDDESIDAFSIGLEPGDTFVLCTDGAEEVVPEPIIARVAEDHSPALLASRIVSEAHHRNPRVDATAVVVRVRSDSEPGWLELSNQPLPATFGHILGYS